MKKLFFAVMLSGLILSSGNVMGADIGDTVVDRIALYIPNRIMDALDMVTVNIGAGLVTEASLQATYACRFGGGIGSSAKLYKAHNRQYGAGLEDGWWWSLGCFGAESKILNVSTPLVQKYAEIFNGTPNPEARIYEIYTGARDYWAVGGSLALGLAGDIYLHPLECLDFVLGCLLIDIKDDDYLFEDF